MKTLATAGVAVLLPFALLSTTGSTAFADTATTGYPAVTTSARTHTTGTTRSHKTGTTKRKKASKNRALSGTVQSISGSAFVLATKTETLTVTVSTATKFVDRTNKTMAPSLIRVGNKVSVVGVRSGTTVAASVVRDTSIPAVGASQ